MTQFRNYFKKGKFDYLFQVYMTTLNLLERYFFHIVLIFCRIHIGKVFWYSGLTKYNDFDTALALFEYEYKVPILPHELAAYSATAVELLCPILLFIGLGARFASLVLISTIFLIEPIFTSHPDHINWFIFLSFILAKGPGNISLDYFIKKNYIR